MSATNRKLSLPLAEAPDETLVDLIRTTHSSRAFDALFNRYQTQVIEVAYRVLHHREDAHEVAQDTWVNAHTKIEQLNDAQSFPAWISRIAFRLALNYKQRVQKRHVATCTGHYEKGHYEVQDDSTPLPIDTLLKTERTEELLEAIEELPTIYREVAVDHYLHGIMLKDLAKSEQHPDLPPLGTIKRRLHQARNRLREAMTKNS